MTRKKFSLADFLEAKLKVMLWPWVKTEPKYLYISCDWKKKTNVLHIFQFKIGTGLTTLCQTI